MFHDIIICQGDIDSFNLSLLVLQVSFSVQVLSLNIADPLGHRGVQQDDIRREELVVRDLDYLADLQLLPPFYLKLLGCPVSNQNRSVVLLPVRLVSLVILENVLHHRYKDNET